jgi:hypothetical protein
MLRDNFRKRSLPNADITRARALIRQLGAAPIATRERAEAGLLALGAGVVPLLRQATEGNDAKDSQAAVKRCLQTFADRGAPAPLPPAAARLLALRKPAGAAEALLAYLPLAPDETMSREIQSALAVLAVRDGKLDPALVTAMADSLPLRRAVAAEVICQAGPPEQRVVVRPLLKDADPDVRLRAALALAGAQDREAIPVLIALLTEVPVDQAELAEDYLRHAAGDQAPNAPLGTEAGERQKCRAAWTAWWRDREAQAGLPRAEEVTRLHGYTLIVETYNPVRRGGRVFEVDTAGKVRWSIEGLQGPTDAEVLPGDRVLITEQNVQRVTERDLKGQILWERTVPNLLRCQQLPNGQRLLVARNQLVVIDRAGKEVFMHTRPAYDILTATRLRDGQFGLFTSNWQYLRLDAAGKERKSAQVNPFPLFGMLHSVEILPNDRLLIAEYSAHKVVEQDLKGKVSWEAAVAGVMSVSRLPNGHTLIASNSPQRVSELDQKGKVVWEYKDGVWPSCAKRR